MIPRLFWSSFRSPLQISSRILRGVPGSAVNWTVEDSFKYYDEVVLVLGGKAGEVMGIDTDEEMGDDIDGDWQLYGPSCHCSV